MKEYTQTMAAERRQLTNEFLRTAGIGFCFDCGCLTGTLDEDGAQCIIEEVTGHVRTGDRSGMALLGAVFAVMECIQTDQLNGPCRCSPFGNPPREGFHLYRLWDDHGRLLYVGVSTRLRNRLRSHARRWGHLIDHVSWEGYEDEQEMLAAERVAIRDENPALNVRGV